MTKKKAAKVNKPAKSVAPGEAKSLEIALRDALSRAVIRVTGWEELQGRIVAIEANTKNIESQYSVLKTRLDRVMPVLEESAGVLTEFRSLKAAIVTSDKTIRSNTKRSTKACESFSSAASEALEEMRRLASPVQAEELEEIRRLGLLLLEARAEGVAFQRAGLSGDDLRAIALRACDDSRAAARAAKEARDDVARALKEMRQIAAALGLQRAETSPA